MRSTNAFVMVAGWALCIGCAARPATVPATTLTTLTTLTTPATPATERWPHEAWVAAQELSAQAHASPTAEPAREHEDVRCATALWEDSRGERRPRRTAPTTATVKPLR